ncbi:MAG: cytochrome c oxidase subunit [Bacteroidetes bacterium]|nr:cytochrome c oxidase subunit [Bacteroidota bacterium]
MLSIKEPTAADKMRQKLKYHPIRVFTYLIIVGITSAFLTLVFGYFATTAGTVWNQFLLPQIFHANTVIILVSSYTVMQMRQANLRDDHKAYKQALLMTAALGMAFTVFQFIGWRELLSHGISFRHNISGTYLYLISGLHLAHLLVGVAFLLWYLYKAYVVDRDAYEALIFETDPTTKLKIEMLGIYWHFVDVLWLFVYISFLIGLYALPRSIEGWFTRPF